MRALEMLPLFARISIARLHPLAWVATPHLALLVKGESQSLSIAAASVLAKTARDSVMCELEGQYPGYGFASHKGYGTAQHRAAIVRLELCPIHRKSFKIHAEEESCAEILKSLRHRYPTYQ